MIGILIKLSDNKFNGKHPNEINEGYTITGDFNSLPEVGQSFKLYHKKLGGIKYFNTSTITKIVSQTDKEILFKTLNSTYSLEITKK